MSYSTFAAALTGSRPVWLYELTYNDVVTRRTADGRAYEIGGHTWEPSTMRHSRIRQSRDSRRADQTLTFASDDAWARQLLSTARAKSRVIIYRTYRNDPTEELVARYRGRIVSVVPGETRIEARCEDAMTRLNAAGLSHRVQRTCPWAVYGDECGASRALQRVAANVSARSGRTLTIAEADNLADGSYVGGLIEYGSSEVMIEAHVGNQITLFRDFPELFDAFDASGPQAVDILRGCDLTPTTCENVFNRLKAYGGLPFLDDTPFEGRSLV